MNNHTPPDDDDLDELENYNHVPPKYVKTVKTRYIYIGKMPPREFTLPDDDDVDRAK